MSFPLVVAVAALAGFCFAAVYAEIRLRLMIGRLNSRLEGLDSRIRGLESDDGSPLPPRPSAVGLSRGPDVAKEFGEPRRRFDPPRLSSFAGPNLIEIPDVAARKPPSEPTADNDLAGRFSEIWASGELGVSTEAIARENGLPRGEVELILGLRKRSSPAISERSGDSERGAK